MAALVTDRKTQFVTSQSLGVEAHVGNTPLIPLNQAFSVG